MDQNFQNGSEYTEWIRAFRIEIDKSDLNIPRLGEFIL